MLSEDVTWKRKEPDWISKTGRHCESKLLEVGGMGKPIPAMTSIMTDVSSCVSMTLGKECAAEDTKLVGQSTHQKEGEGVT